ncbi:MAG: hypothetical protein J0J15_22590, partial [Mesorhizobium sp.]|nr:hypothetical protein [Mesorhizobium sp.]
TGLPAFLVDELPRALWLAFIPIAVVSGGLAFHEGVSARRAAGACPAKRPPRRGLTGVPAVLVSAAPELP